MRQAKHRNRRDASHRYDLQALLPIHAARPRTPPAIPTQSQSTSTRLCGPSAKSMKQKQATTLFAWSLLEFESLGRTITNLFERMLSCTHLLGSRHHNCRDENKRHALLDFCMFLPVWWKLALWLYMFLPVLFSWKPAGASSKSGNTVSHTANTSSSQFEPVPRRSAFAVTFANVGMTFGKSHFDWDGVRRCLRGLKEQHFNKIIWIVYGHFGLYGSLSIATANHY